MSETEYDKPKSMVLLEGLLGQQLPIEFKLFHAAGCSLLRFEREGQVWCFPSPRGLMEQLNEGRINTRYILQLECYASLLKSRTETKAVPIEEGSRMQLSRLRRGLAVADSGGDILFLD